MGTMTDCSYCMGEGLDSRSGRDCGHCDGDGECDCSGCAEEERISAGDDEYHRRVDELMTGE